MVDLKVNFRIIFFKTDRGCIMRKKKFLLVFFMLSIYFLNFNNTSINQYNTTENDSTVHYPRNSAASGVFFGTSIAGRTTIEVDQYYIATNTLSEEQYYAEIQLIAGQIYYIYTSDTTTLYLFRDSRFSEEIESCTSYYNDIHSIVYAPKITSNYYIRFSGGKGSFDPPPPSIGVSKVDKYNASQTQQGIAFTFVNDDCTRSVIYFNAPDAATCMLFFDMVINLETLDLEFLYKQIDLKSDQSFDENELILREERSDLFGDDIKNNSGKGFLIIIPYEGNFQIDLSGCPTVLGQILFYIVVIILNILFLFVVIYVRVIRKRRKRAPEGVKIKGPPKEKKVAKKKVKKESVKKKEKKQLAKLKEGQLDPETLKKIRQIITVSTKVKLDFMQEALGMSDYVFKNLINDWAEKYGFEIEGDYIIINKETINEFMDDLDEAFKGWGDEKDHKKI